MGLCPPRWLAATFVTGSLSVALIIPAQADPPPGDDPSAYAAAHGAEICDFIARDPVGREVVLLLKKIVDETGMPVGDASIAVGDAVKAHCPQYLPLLEEMARPPLW